MSADDALRRTILRRRAAFVQASLAAIVGCGGPQAPTNGRPPEVSLRSADASATAEDEDLVTATGAPDASFEDAGNSESDAASDEPRVVVRVCLSIIRPPPVRFDPGATLPLPPAVATLDEVAGVMVQHPEIIVEVQGHTDSTEVFAKPLSEKRARVVKQELVRRGVEASRLCVRGFGAERPLDANQTARGRAMNRRIEYRILEPEDPCVP